jgi:hypothetical protein
MAKETPLQAMKRLYTSKDKLIDSIVDAVKLDGEDKGAAKERLKAVSNKKLMRLAKVTEAIKASGGREKVVSAIGAAVGRAKDSDYLKKLGTLSSGRLVDMLQAAEKRAKKSA